MPTSSGRLKVTVDAPMLPPLEDWRWRKGPSPCPSQWSSSAPGSSLPMRSRDRRGAGHGFEAAVPRDATAGSKSSCHELESGDAPWTRQDRNQPAQGNTAVCLK